MIAVIGVGNDFRRDDGVGPAVIAELRTLAPDAVSLLATDGDPTVLIEAWDGADLAVVVDAAHSGTAEPGVVHRAADVQRSSGSTASSHALGIADAIRLAEALGRMPRRLVIYAVEVADLGYGQGLSAPVRAAVPHVVAAVLDDIAATNEPPAR